MEVWPVPCVCVYLFLQVVIFLLRESCYLFACSVNVILFLLPNRLCGTFSCAFLKVNSRIEFCSFEKKFNSFSARSVIRQHSAFASGEKWGHVSAISACGRFESRKQYIF